MYTNPIDQLLQEHRSIMAQVADLETAVAALAAHGESALPDNLSVFSHIGRMMATELEEHRLREDDVLFPALEELIGRQGPTAVMRYEHQLLHDQGELLRETLHELNEVQHPAIEAGGEQIRALAANGGSAAELQATGQEIIELLQAHFSKEEGILFPMARNMLDEEVLAEIAARFQEMG